MAAPLLSGALAAALAWGTVPVARVSFQPENVQSISDLRRAFGVTAGQPLSRAAIRHGVQALIASRAVEDVVVEVNEQADGIQVVVRLQLTSRVSAIEVGGVSRRERLRIVSDLSVAVGDPLSVGGFERGLERARLRLGERSYLAATLEPDLEFDVPRGQVRVLLDVTLGEPARVQSVEAPGSELAAAELWRRSGLSAGDRASVDRLERVRRRLLESLRRDGYWESEVEVPEVQSVAGAGVARFAVRRGPCWHLVLDGVERSKGIEQEALLFLGGDEPFSEAALDLTVGRVRTYLQRQGFLLAEVTGEIAEVPPCRQLRLAVAHRVKTPIEAVRYPGLHSLPVAGLKEKIGARAGHPWWWGREGIDDETLAADAESLLATLQDAGFPAATVAKPRLVAEGGGVAIEFPVEEGRRHLVRALSVDGVPASVKVQALPLAVGGPWSADAEARERDAVLLALQDAGFADARVTAEHRCEEGECDVTVVATPNEPVRTLRMVITGLSKTRKSVVEKVAAFDPERPLGPTEQLAMQRRLLGLGLFQRAALRPIPGQNAGPERGWVLDLGEAPTRAFGFGIGWDTVEHLRVSASWSEVNLFGRAGIVTVLGRYSDRQRLWEVSYRERGNFGLIGIPNWTSIYRTEESFPSFHLLRRGMWIQLGDLERRPLRKVLRYDYQVVESDAPPEVLSQLERDQQNIAITGLTPILEWDTRDDVFMPRRGTFASVQLQVAFKAFLGDSSFEKLSLELSRFQPVLGGVLAGGVRAGVIWPRPAVGGSCDVLANPQGCDNLAVPIAVRLFGGGRISHRAFATDLLGIPGSTLICPSDKPHCLPTELEPVGGAGLALSNFEWRFPIFNVVGGDLFVDGGNIWSSGSEIRLADFRWGAGLGLRVETPVGPIRLEYGWKLDRMPGESKGELFLSLGNSF
jgi:outer membrane protein insertion porin family